MEKRKSQSIKLNGSTNDNLDKLYPEFEDINDIKCPNKIRVRETEAGTLHPEHELNFGLMDSEESTSNNLLCRERSEGSMY